MQDAENQHREGLPQGQKTTQRHAHTRHAAELNFVGNLHWPPQKKKCRKPETRPGYTSDTKLFVVVCTQIGGTDHGTAEQHSPIEIGGWTDG